MKPLSIECPNMHNKSVPARVGKWIQYIKHNLIILDELRDLCETYHERICGIESAKYDTEKEVEFKDYQISDLNIAVNDLRGKL